MQLQHIGRVGLKRAADSHITGGGIQGRRLLIIEYGVCQMFTIQIKQTRDALAIEASRVVISYGTELRYTVDQHE